MLQSMISANLMAAHSAAVLSLVNVEIRQMALDCSYWVQDAKHCDGNADFVGFSGMDIAHIISC